LLRDPDLLSHFDVDLLRIDSPGENARVTEALIALGDGPKNVVMDLGEINYLGEYYIGFWRALQWILLRRIPCLNSPSDIRVMFHKGSCHHLFAEHGIARPTIKATPQNYPLLHDWMRAEESGQVFLKPCYGSSASGVCALRWKRGAQQLIAPLRIQSRNGEPILVNSLKVHTYTTEADIEQILSLLLPQRMIMERWIPKLSLPGGVIDLRVLVIAGEARHWVVRQSQHPMTNLHLGNRRGDPDALQELIGEEKLKAAFELAERAAACFPESLYAGVDVLIDTRHRPLIGEINAFGDLLPGLMHRGESAYTAIANACHAHRCFI
jgi:hypothetical protein